MKHKKLRIKNLIHVPDVLLRKRIAGIQSSFFGIHHTVWQLIYSIYEKKCIHKAYLVRLMHSFADEDTINKILIKLKIECVIFNAEDKITLTSNGMELYKSYLEQV